MKRITRKQPHLFVLTFLFFPLITLSQVGINNTNPATTLDVNGALSLREGAVLNLNNGNNNDIPLGATPFSVYRITGPNSIFNIGSLVPAAASDGQIVTLLNTTSEIMFIRHDAGGTAAYRIFVPGERDLYLHGTYSNVTLQYNATSSRWYVTNSSSGKYGDNMQYSLGTTNATYNSATFADIPQMSVTFTPVHDVVYVNFSAAGYMGLSAENAYVDFRLINVSAGNAVLGGTSSLATDFDFDDIFGTQLTVSWNAHMTMFPVTVTPGVPVTLKMQWRRDGIIPDIIVNNVASEPDYSHRNLTIMD